MVLPSAEETGVHRKSWFTAIGVVLCIAACKLLVHFYSTWHDGYFRDELYYLACSRHLAWGYVDQPPLIALIAWFVRSTMGDSLFAIRLLPALAGTFEVVLAGLIARELGGGKGAQGLAALSTLVAGGILALDSFLSMNAFEPLFWLGCAWLVIRVVKTGDQRLWIWFGILAGLGLENKHSMLIFGAAIFVGLILTPQRKVFLSPWIWIGGAIALLIFLPNLLWNIQHHFPFIELQRNIRNNGRDVPLSPLAFFGQEILTMHPLTLPIWLAGLWFFFSAKGKPFRVLGWAWIFIAAVIVTLSPRIYYLYPAFPILFAAGAVFWEAHTHWKRYVWPIAIAASAIIVAPFAIPLLPPETYIRYAKALHFNQPAIETHRLGPLPQFFADRFGWEEMTATVARVYNALPAEIRPRTAIFGQNYGEASAIDMFGAKYGLPPAISGHQNYFLWGPRGYTGESVIVMHGDPEVLASKFAEVQKVATVYHPYSMPFEHFDVFYCQGLKRPLSEIWPTVKQWN
ncbi:MAG TPA: glycosyltransferase family 39 protein [Bryobacteraceae bacterium]|jgi:4-amino-4-deoxy-L-arabinose transferase-like glycosyltransferase|nr:glycosyltransferase family 39 protein [Bryobacteraceae bacterium]